MAGRSIAHKSWQQLLDFFYRVWAVGELAGKMRSAHT